MRFFILIKYALRGVHNHDKLCSYTQCVKNDKNKIESVTEKWYNMNKETSLIYEGQFHRAEWYYDENGYSQAYEYFLKTNANQKRKFLILVKKISDFGMIYDKTKFRNEGDGIYAFKPQPDRYLCFFFDEKKIIVTNAFMKKTDKLPVREKDKALKIRHEYKRRNIV